MDRERDDPNTDKRDEENEKADLPVGNCAKKRNHRSHLNLNLNAAK